MDETFDIEDDSGDRKYFTIVPNYILNHSTMWDREVYIQMKRIAGDKGKCWASRSTLAKQCGMSVHRLDTCIKYLLEHEWIKRVGTKKILTAGGVQEVYEYQIVDLWKKNIEFYEQGSPRNAHPTPKVVHGQAKGSPPEAYKEEPYKKNPPSELRSRGYQITSSLERKSEDKVPAKYPNARAVFAWFPHPQPSWQINTTELKHAELLFERGEKKVRGALAFIQSHADEEYMPQITKPSDLERKWLDLVTWSNKNDV